MVALGVSACRVHPRLAFAALVGEQSPHWRGGGPVHRRLDMALLEALCSMDANGKRVARARGACPERVRRREPRAVGVSPALRPRFPDPVSPGRAREWPSVLGRIL